MTKMTNTNKRWFVATKLINRTCTLSSSSFLLIKRLNRDILRKKITIKQVENNHKASSVFDQQPCTCGFPIMVKMSTASSIFHARFI